MSESDFRRLEKRVQKAELLLEQALGRIDDLERHLFPNLVGQRNTTPPTVAESVRSDDSGEFPHVSGA